ncbi:hypothetical protein D3C80_1989460 [compost metagenome]
MQVVFSPLALRHGHFCATSFQTHTFKILSMGYIKRPDHFSPIPADASAAGCSTPAMGKRIRPRHAIYAKPQDRSVNFTVNNQRHRT